MDDDVIPFIHGQQIFERAPKPLEPLWLESKLPVYSQHLFPFLLKLIRLRFKNAFDRFLP